MRKSVLFLFIVVLSGCASIVGEKTQLVTVNSSPSGAKILIKDENGREVYRGATPMSITLEKGDGYFQGKDYKVLIGKRGYDRKILKISSTAGGWYLWGNLGFGGLIGWLVVDPLTGAMWNLEPEHLDIPLNKKSRRSKSSTSFNVVSLKDIPSEMRGKMKRVD